MNKTVPYTADEILEIFREQHRLCSPLDCMADATFELTRATYIYEWREAQDLQAWEELSDFLNQEFRIEVSRKTWKTIFNPDTRRTLGDLCDFVATVAQKEVIQPIKMLGTDCLSAAIFLTLKRKLKEKGVMVNSLRPSTKLQDFLETEENFSPLIEELTLTGVKIFDKIEYEAIHKERRYKHWYDFVFAKWIIRRPLNTGNIQTFRDVVLKIMDNKVLNAY